MNPLLLLALASALAPTSAHRNIHLRHAKPLTKAELAQVHDDWHMPRVYMKDLVKSAQEAAAKVKLSDEEKAELRKAFSAMNTAPAKPEVHSSGAPKEPASPLTAPTKGKDTAPVSKR
eukprot:gnl/TRDRNA2_/TRDRNA2_179112_c0_seq1.p1 gnl/TRDRNA2_/TRDRNA2_179112_c0~~gnl/TRDRNA2_/TRDRNA2_179112_c0_seq1.p1  ORF type:complete len:118 (-),score=33.91 gnl/TRDRNA2_/TRDRNA2_179112_c0_seq1:214-567(-)